MVNLDQSLFPWRSCPFAPSTVHSLLAHAVLQASRRLPGAKPVKADRIKIVQLLLEECRADPNFSVTTEDCRPLQYALCKPDCLMVVQMLLTSGADVHHPIRLSYKPHSMMSAISDNLNSVHIAALSKEENSKVMSLLLETDTELLNSRTDAGLSPLTVSLSNPLSETTETILRYYPDLNCTHTTKDSLTYSAITYCLDTYGSKSQEDSFDALKEIIFRNPHELRRMSDKAGTVRLVVEDPVTYAACLGSVEAVVMLYLAGFSTQLLHQCFWNRDETKCLGSEKVRQKYVASPNELSLNVLKYLPFLELETKTNDSCDNKIGVEIQEMHIHHPSTTSEETVQNKDKRLCWSAHCTPGGSIIVTRTTSGVPADSRA